MVSLKVKTLSKHLHVTYIIHNAFKVTIGNSKLSIYYEAADSSEELPEPYPSPRTLPKLVVRHVSIELSLI